VQRTAKHLCQRAKLALPNKSVDYTVQDLPAIAKAGALARPSVRFTSNEQQLAAAYDIVFAQGSFQYIKGTGTVNSPLTFRPSARQIGRSEHRSHADRKSNRDAL
jgi:hypothetical protein